MDRSRDISTGGGVEKRSHSPFSHVTATNTSAGAPSTPASSPAISHLAKGGRFSNESENVFLRHRGPVEQTQMDAEQDPDCRAMVLYRPGSAPSPRTVAHRSRSSKKCNPPILALPPSTTCFTLNSAAASLRMGSCVSRRIPLRPREIPSEVFPIVFQYMDAATLCSVSPVCKEWREQGNDDRYWRRLCRSRFNVTPDSFAPPPDPIKRLYQLQHGSLRAMRRGRHPTYHAAPQPISAHISAQLFMGLMATNAV